MFAFLFALNNSGMIQRGQSFFIKLCISQEIVLFSQLPANSHNCNSNFCRRVLTAAVI